MENEIIDQTLLSEISKVCKDNQDEYASGHYFITNKGLKNVAKLLGGDYSKLTKNQKKEFRKHCINTVTDFHCCLKTWWYYLNI